MHSIFSPLYSLEVLCTEGTEDGKGEGREEEGTLKREDVGRSEKKEEVHKTNIILQPFLPLSVSL